MAGGSLRKFTWDFGVWSGSHSGGETSILPCLEGVM